jgi:hypothetical protein
MTGSPLRVTLSAAALVLLAGCGDSSRQRSADTLAAATDTGIPSTPVGEPIPQEGSFVDPNSATREQLVASGLTADAADALVAARPHADMVAVDRALSAHVADSAARREIYSRVWMPIDLNTASAAEIQLIPGVGPRLRHEFEEYRPYSNMAQFRREIGKYVDEREVARLERYVAIR